ncbi:MAG TPA: electron transport complex subunit RsxC [Ruminococcaceae bacterium]|nr:electron transport complex subunit RsxC [Oscillospiraceae bacterium]
MHRLSTIFLKDCKHSILSQTKTIPLPEELSVSMAMSLGAPCKPVVEAGDMVKTGQVIGESEDGKTVPIHAPADGAVLRVEEANFPNMRKAQQIVIRTKSTSFDFTPPDVQTREEFLSVIKNSGIVGLGGAAFPTFAKLDTHLPIETLIVNAAECEPYLTSDYRTMLENTDDVFLAAETVRKFVKCRTVIFGIEENKPEAIALFEKKCGEHENIWVKILKSRYPQGAEKVLIYHTTGIIQPQGVLPAQLGVLVLNVTTMAKIGLFLRTGEPLIRRRITVDGDLVPEPCNLEVPIGTRVCDIVKVLKIPESEIRKILFGGPMMGVAVSDIRMPILKSTNGVLFFSKEKAVMPAITPCIRCGRCFNACPFHLMPAEFDRKYRNRDREALKRLHILSCMECGCCAYVCPAKRDLVATNRLAKNWVRSGGKV